MQGANEMQPKCIISSAEFLKNYVPPEKDWGGWTLDGLTLEYHAYAPGPPGSGTYPIGTSS
jgi:hypothetical protein